MLKIQRNNYSSKAHILLVVALSTFVTLAMIGHTSTISAISVSDISGTDFAPVSVSVSNSPLAYYISVSSSHGSYGSPVSLSYTMDGSGNQLGNVVSSSDIVTIDTNSPMSHQLLLSTTSDNTTTKANNLVGDNTQEESGSLVPNTYIAPSNSSSLNSATALSSNTWGFALNNSTPGIVTNNFDSDYSTVTNSSKFTSVPAKNSEVLVLEDTTATSTTTIYYGVLADRSLPAGDYSNTILYTALAEQPRTIEVIPNSGEKGNVITIYTPINTTDIAEEVAIVKFYQTINEKYVEKGACVSPTVKLDGGNYLYVICSLPLMANGTYSMELTLTNLGMTFTEDDAITYTSTAFGGITTMQEMTNAICSAAPEGTTARLRDTRGRGNAGQAEDDTYSIIKAKDGNCWMTENLDLYNANLSYTESDFTSGTFTLPASSNWTVTTNTQARLHIATNEDYEGEIYYNWSSAIAVANTTSITTQQNTSICPKNWRIPIGSSSTSTNKSWAKLFNAYGATVGADLVNPSHSAYVLGFYKYYGMWDNERDKETIQGWGGYFWTSTATTTNTNAYTLHYYPGSLRPAYSERKAQGRSIRCVSR